MDRKEYAEKLLSLILESGALDTNFIFAPLPKWSKRFLDIRDSVLRYQNMPQPYGNHRHRWYLKKDWDIVLMDILAED